MTWQKRTLLGIGLAIVICGTTSVAHAQQYGAPPPGYAGYPPPPPPPQPQYGIYRSGLLVGAGLGVGGISAQNCGDACGVAAALELHIGGMITPQVAIVGDFWFNFHSIPNSDATTTHSLYTVALQYWPADKFWLKGGLGGSNMNISSSYGGTYGDENGFGLMAAGGIEFLQMGNFALDGQLRFGHGFFSEGGDVNVWALMIGANWY